MDGGPRRPGPFGDPTRPPIAADEIVRRLADLGVWGVTFHDDDLLPPGISDGERQRILTDFRKALDETGLVVSMVTCNLFAHPIFKDGAFTANDPSIRRHAIAKSMRAIDLGAEFGAKTYVLWGGREGTESYAAAPPIHALDRYREAVDFLAGYATDRDYGMRFAIEPKPNEPRGDTFLPTVGHVLSFIQSLDHRDMVGVNPEVAHETMAGLSFFHGVAQAIWADKLFHVDLNAQKPSRYDQDLRFGSEGIKDTFFFVKLLEDSAYDGPRQFDARPYRSERDEGVWDFARGCMRTYLAMAEKAKQFDEDAEIIEALAYAKADQLAGETVGPYRRETADALHAASFDVDALAAQTYGNDRLDQLVIDLLLGVRG